MDTNPIPAQIATPELMQEISAGLLELLEFQAQLKAEIATLEQAGCIAGYLVSEYRKEHGPYYRLHFYTNFRTGEKPAPQYIGADEAKVAIIRQQIGNQLRREAIHKRLQEIEGAIHSVGKSFKQINDYIGMRLVNFEQLPLLPEQPSRITEIVEM